MHAAITGLWPHEVSALQALGQKAQPITAPPQDLQPVAPAATEHEHVARERILGEPGLHQCGQAIKAVAQIRRSAGQPYPGPCRKAQHRAAANTSRSIAPSTTPRTRTMRCYRSI